MRRFQCAVCGVQCILCSVQCAVAVFRGQCTLYTRGVHLQCLVCTTHSQCAVCSVWCVVYGGQCVVCSVWCADNSRQAVTNLSPQIQNQKTQIQGTKGQNSKCWFGLRGQDLAFERAMASVLTSGKEEKRYQSLYINLWVHMGKTRDFFSMLQTYLFGSRKPQNRFCVHSQPNIPYSFSFIWPSKSSLSP